VKIRVNHLYGLYKRSYRDINEGESRMVMLYIQVTQMLPDRSGDGSVNESTENKYFATYRAAEDRERRIRGRTAKKPGS
jgi:hypothetical protein